MLTLIGFNKTRHLSKSITNVCNKSHKGIFYTSLSFISSLLQNGFNLKYKNKNAAYPIWVIQQFFDVLPTSAIDSLYPVFAGHLLNGGAIAPSRGSYAARSGAVNALSRPLHFGRYLRCTRVPRRGESRTVVRYRSERRASHKFCGTIRALHGGTTAALRYLVPRATLQLR